MAASTLYTILPPILLVVMFGLIMAPVVVVAQAPASSPTFNSGFDEVKKAGTDNKIKERTLPEFITAILGFALAFVAILAAATLIYGGFMYITSFGNEGKAETAKHLILYAIIGLIVIGVSALVVNVVINTFIKA